MDKVNLAEKFALFTEHWSPKIVGEVNGMHVKIGKIQGRFEWHSHANEDELFLVVAGRMVLRFRDKDVEGPARRVHRGAQGAWSTCPWPTRRPRS